ncbi:Kinase A inhibitor [bioreactor metagenome]|uniref:Kinase A inhibitor n=1 Tax=bioreactor metagenome TaxID=1076179 RepID=A0A644TRT6_9ZZZZ|nr:5-oxoprolinase subunit PxpB [Negativicutes bacterium]
MYQQARYLPAGDKSLVVEFGNEISEAVNGKIRGMMVVLEENPVEGITELVPTYRSLAVYYEPLVISYDDLCLALGSIEEKLGMLVLPNPKIVEIPTAYGAEFGPDIEFVARHNQLSVEEVIAIHTETEYLIYMLGFTPGFTYLGGMSEKIVTPRLKIPRTTIPKGSVGIAGAQTGIYPIDSPGGWQLIGRTPLLLYDPSQDIPVLLQAGDYVRFVPINASQYHLLESQIRSGEYRPVTYEMDRRG